MRFLYFLICLFSVLSAHAEGEGLDCEKANSWTTEVICHAPDEVLYELDAILNDVCQKKIENLGAKAAAIFRKEQLSWIKELDQCYPFPFIDQEQCVRESYEARLASLGAVDELLSAYREQCEAVDWACERLGALEIQFARWPEAVRDLTERCNRTNNCFHLALALEHLGKKQEALDAANMECEPGEPASNEACALVNRLSGKKSKNRWVGLYRPFVNSRDTLFVEETSDGKVALTADTYWSNGHTCNWKLQGKVQGNKLKPERDMDNPACKPIVTRRGTTITVKDPGWKCKAAYCGARAVYEGTFRLEERNGR